MMKYSLKLVAAASCMAVAGTLCGGDATAPYGASHIDARLNVSIKPDTKVVHFVRDNNDPNVITKVYVLKHVDPYELRTYIRKMVQTRRVTSCNTNVRAIKYTDGTSVLLISAEDYRFADNAAGMGFDSIVRELDKPGMVTCSGRPTYVYVPKYRSAAYLQNMVSAIGANLNDAATNTIGTTDALANDPGLNLMFFKTAPFSRQNILNVLAEYDRPAPELRAKITVYELYAENDTKLGLDFQAWKNNDGIDIFSAGARYMHNYAPDGSALVKGAKWGDTQYFSFNPKWNTKYIDFLTSRGKARVLHSSEMRLTNGLPGNISRTTNVFLAVDADAAEKDEDEQENNSREVSQNVYSFTNLAAGTVLGFTRDGKEVVVANGVGRKPYATAVEQTFNGVTKFTIHMHDGSLLVGGKASGRNAAVASLADGFVFVTTSPLEMQQGRRTSTVASGRSFGFEMTLTPAISSEASILNVNIKNSSLIGYTSSGEARIQQGAEVNTKFMIANTGSRLVIGGIEKRDVVRVSGGVPLLKDLPVIGWIFSTESESTKRSQLVVVAEVIPVPANETITAPQRSQIESVQGELSRAGDNNTFGYRQFFLDPSRTK